MLEEHLRTSQFCRVPGNSIIEAVSIVREAVAHAEVTDTPLCVLTLDFREAFVRIAREYLFTISKSYGTSPWFIDRIKDLYENATASIQINGKLAGPIPIQCAIRQGCPLSMLLYTLCASIASHAGKPTTLHLNRAPSAKNSSRSIRRPRNDICDVPDRLQDNTRSHPDL